jgi:hypothetical protein
MLRETLTMRGVLAATAIALLCLGACETGPTPYQRAGADTRGYSEMRIENDRYRITFRGNSSTSRDVVETYMLYRAAELTLQNGFDTFTVAHRETDKDVRLHSYGGYYGGFWGYPYYGGGYWGPYWGPYWGGGWGPSYDTSTRYEANIEILMGRAAGENAADVFDARQVTQNLGGAIQRAPPVQ